MKSIDWSNVEEAKDFERLQPGGYIAKITSVEDLPDKEYLRMEYDIADGDFAGYYQDLYRNRGFWGGSFIRSYKEKALSFFKAFKTAVENSNPGYQFNNDESTLKGTLIGLVLGEEEYKANDGSVKTRLYVDKTRSVKEIKSGNFEVPAKKLLPADQRPRADFSAVDIDASDDLPFA